MLENDSLMKIIFLSKRRPQSKDLYTRPAGRFYFLPKILADQGHEVHLVLLNYKVETEFTQFRDKIYWHSVNLLPNPINYYLFIKKLTLQVKPDYIVGFSDIIYGIYAQKISNTMDCLSVIDAYDNYESYIPWLKPLHWLWRRSLKKSNLITAAGPELLEKLTYGRCRNKIFGAVIEMAADPVFVEGSQSKSRAKFGMPINKFIIGYSGSLVKNRDISTMLNAFVEISSIFPNVCFAFSGRRDKDIDLSMVKNKIMLGYVNDQDVPDVVRCFDLLVSVNRNSEFGNYSYPAKLYEALAVGVPVIASKTLSTSYVLRDYPEALFEPESKKEIVEKIKWFINKPYTVKKLNYGWQNNVKVFEDILLSYRQEKYL